MLIRPWYRACLLALIAIGACTRQPQARPTPTPPHPVTTLPPTEPPHPSTSVRRFSYATGEHIYLLITDAAVSVATDSMPPVSSEVRTRAIYSLMIDTTTGAPRISGSISGSLDSLVIDRGPRVPAAADFPTLPLHWDASTPPADSTDCSLAEELMQSGRELLPQLPGNLPDGHRWRDTAATHLCRAGIPVTVSAVHNYEVIGPTAFQGDSALQVSRTTNATLDGSRNIGQHLVTLSGTANTTAQLYLDLGKGTLLARTEQGHMEISIQTPRTTTNLTQELRAQLVRQPRIEQ